MERSTRQRSAIRTVFARIRRPLSPQEVLAAARAVAPTLGIATVYRNLRALADSGVITQVVLPGAAPRYELAQVGSEQHQHFQCTQCHRVFDVPGRPGDFPAMFSALVPPGFVVHGHEITLYGLCADCRRQATRH